MKRTFATISLLGLLVGSSLVPAVAQDGEAQKIEEGKKILGKIVDAFGGRDRLLKIQDTKVACNINIIPVNMSGSLVISEKKNKIRQDISIMGMNIIQAYNGKTGWMVDPMTGAIVDMPDAVLEQFKREALGNDALLNPGKYGITFTFEGRESVEGKEYLLLKQTHRDGFETTMYVDPDTFLVHKTMGMTVTETLEKTDQETTLSDYRDVDGTKVPFSVKIKQGGVEYAEITMTEYTYDANLEDSLFEKPGIAGE